MVDIEKSLSMFMIFWSWKLHILKWLHYIKHLIRKKRLELQIFIYVKLYKKFLDYKSMVELSCFCVRLLFKTSKNI